MERVLITGANGHLGQRLLLRLRGSGSGGGSAAACALVRSPAAAEAVRGLTDADACKVVDYQDVDGLARAAQGFDAIVHLVGILKETSRSRYTEAHESTCYALARAAEKAGIRRIVYLSILGASPSARNTCLKSKGRAEAILLERDVPATVIRLPMVLGPGDYASRALRAQAMTGVLPLVRGGATREQPIDSEDVTTAVLRAVGRTGAPAEALDLAGPESLSHRDLVLRAAGLLGRQPRIVKVPLRLARMAAFVAERLLANPPLTRAMLEVLEHDDDIDPGPACRALGLKLTPLDETLRRCVLPETSA